jgi:hypothetical protein
MEKGVEFRKRRRISQSGESSLARVLLRLE